ncbi:MAG: glycerol kinase, partial [Bacteroidetes bacterium]|nr:glycerol kinase [Bacteroidota bacterium]
LGALGGGDFNSVEDINNIWKLNKRYVPSIGDDERNSLIEKWKKAVQRSMKWIES